MLRHDLTFRVFVSSTFSDLVAERNALQKTVFPALQAYCRAKGAHFQAIDLRWGVSEEAALDQETMKICVQELQRCQELSPRPNFIVLLGNRYGWRPLPPQIDAAEFDSLLERLSEEERGSLFRWFRRDDNALLAEYCLQPRSPDGVFSDPEAWDEEERRLLGMLRRVVDEIFPIGGTTDGGRDPRRCKYEDSATHQEIREGTLRVEDAEKHVFCYFRDIQGLPEDGSARWYRDMRRAESGGEAVWTLDGEAQSRLTALTDELEKLLPPDHVYKYKADWEDCEPRSDLRGLCERVESDLKRIIDRELADFQRETDLERERRTHREFAEGCSQHFTGRATVLDALGEYLRGEFSRPLILHGRSGCGKTALLAKSSADHIREGDQAVVLSRFIGATPSSSDLRTLLIGLCREMGAAYDRHADPPDELSDLVREFANRLTWSTRERPLIVYLDGLDQLGVEKYAYFMNWFPEQLTTNTKLVISVLGTTEEVSECFLIARKIFPPECFLELGQLEVEHGRELLDLWLREARRSLQPGQRDHLLSRFSGCPYPLYLKLAFEEARRWKSYDDLPERSDGTRGLGSDIPSVVNDLFLRLEQPKHHGRVLTSHALGYLAAGRSGLSEDELLDVLSSDEKVMNDFTLRSPTERAKPMGKRLKRLPVLLWSRLHADLEPYLARRTAGDTVVLSFYHRQIGETVAKAYLGGGERGERHHALAGYFETLPSSPRRIRELPWQLARIKSWERLHDLLRERDFLETAWAENEYEVKEYWVQIEGNSSYRVADAYGPVLKTVLAPGFNWCVALLLKDTGHPREALIFLTTLERHHRRRSERALLAKALGNQAAILHSLGELNQALELHEEEEGICRTIGDREGLHRALGNRALILQARGIPDEALALHKEEEDICRELGDRNGLSISLGNQAIVHLSRGEIEEAIPLVAEAEEICQGLGDKAGLLRILSHQSSVLWARGDLEGAMKRLEEREAICRSLGDRKSLQATLGNRAVILRMLGNLAAALELLEEQARTCRDLGLPEDLAGCLGNQASIQRAAGELDKAEELHKNEEEVFYELGARNGIQKSVGNRGLVLLDKGDLDGAMVLFKEKEEICRELRNRDGLAYALSYQAMVHTRRGEPATALDLLEEEGRLLRFLPNKSRLRCSTVNRAQILKELNRPDDLATILRETDIDCETPDEAEHITVLFNEYAAYLSDSTERHEEALALIEKACQLVRENRLTHLEQEVHHNRQEIRARLDGD